MSATDADGDALTVVPSAPPRWSTRGVRAAVVVYVLGLLVASGWLMATADDEPLETSLIASLLGGLVLGHAYGLGAGSVFWWAGQPRLTVAQARRVTARVGRAERARIAQAIRRSTLEPPMDVPAALPYARVQHGLVPHAGALLLVAGPLLLEAIYHPPGPGWGWLWVGVLVAIIVVADGVLWWTLRARIAVSRWSDPPAALEVPLHHHPAYLNCNWTRWARDTTRAQVLAVVSVVVLLAGTAACLLLRRDPASGTACLVVAGVVVTVEFALLLVGWPAYQRHVRSAEHQRRVREVPLAARADLTRALRRGRPTDPRYDDVALVQARAAAVDSAYVPPMFGTLLGPFLALTSPLLGLPVPDAFYLGLGALAVVLAVLLLRLSRRHQHAVEALLARTRVAAGEHAASTSTPMRTLTVAQRPSDRATDPPGSQASSGSHGSLR